MVDVLLGLRLLRRHVVRRAEGRARLRHALVGAALGALEFRDAEVEHLGEVGIAAALDQVDVLGLEIAVDDALGVRFGQRLAHLIHDVDDAAQRLRAVALDLLIPVATVEEFEHHEERAIGHATHVRDFDDVFVADRRGRQRLLVEARDDLGVLGQLSVEHLDRDASLDQRVLALVHRAHTAFADLSDDAITVLEHRPQQGILHHDRLK